jgi:hypothetical protein
MSNDEITQIMKMLEELLDQAQAQGLNELAGHLEAAIESADEIAMADQNDDTYSDNDYDDN